LFKLCIATSTPFHAAPMQNESDPFRRRTLRASMICSVSISLSAFTPVL
jgi:hypothetical protein